MLTNLVRNTLVFLGVFSFFAQGHLQAFSRSYLEDRFLGSTFGCAIGDAMGRPTEFKTVEEIFKSYPNGVKTPDDFREKDFWFDESGVKYAPYTDDTAMAKLVFEQLIDSKKNGSDINSTMEKIAGSFVEDLYKPLGWADSRRAPGNTCLAGVRELERRLKLGFEGEGPLWDVQASNGGGCGSVMRAFPFGLIFYDDLKKAEEWAVAHSRLTHGAPISLAACAAMSVGVALCVQQKDPLFIVEKMIEVAAKYDKKTASMISEAANQAKKDSNAFGDRGILCFERVHDLSKPIFGKFQGWTAHEAIAAATYTFVIAPNNVKLAHYLGVHTPGDSDSIACMAGALVGARVGMKGMPQEWVDVIEGYAELRSLAIDAAKLVAASPN